MPTQFKSRRAQSFRKAFDNLSPAIQSQARAVYAFWKTDPFHPSLHFKSVGKGVWSIRINDNYRALGVMEGDTVTWHWIGSHREYEGRI